MKKVLLVILGLVLIVLVGAGAFYMMYMRPFLEKMKVPETIAYNKQLTLVLAGGGGNSGILVGDSGVLVIDTKMDEGAEAFANKVKEMAGNKPITVVNTHIHKDHSGGNKFFKGQTIIAGGNYDKDFWIHDAGAENLPTIWLKDSMVIPLGDDTATIINLGWSAHTQSDVVVYLSKEKMLFTGDVVLNKQSPALFARYTADANGYLKAFDFFEKRFEINKVVPGHGAIGGVEVIDNFRIFFRDMETVASDASKKGELFSKYSNWGQIPAMMSPGATVAFIKKAKE